MVRFKYLEPLASLQNRLTRTGEMELCKAITSCRQSSQWQLAVRQADDIYVRSWVAVKELHVSYHNPETTLFTVYPKKKI